MANVIATLIAEGLDDFKGAMEDAKSSLSDVGAGAKESEGDLGGLSKGFVDGAKSAAVMAGGAVALSKGFSFVKGATADAEGLARATAGLQRTTGMDARAASGWVSIAKSRGIETNTLTRSFVAFSKQLTGAQQGAKGAASTFQRLGISQKELAGLNTDQALSKVSDALAKMPNGAEKAALTQQLLGRAGQQLLPVLNEGSAGIQKQMDVMQKYGLTMDQQGVDKALKLTKANRELEAAQQGIRVAFGTAFLPILTKVATGMLAVVGPVSQFVSGSKTAQVALVALTAVLGVMVAGLLVYKAAVFLMPAITAAWTAAQWLLNAALTANPIALVVVAIAAFIAALVLAYNKVGWFRDGVNAAVGGVVAAFNWVKDAAANVFNWIKSNWPLLLGILGGPFGLAVALIVTHFDKIKSAASSVASAVVGFFKGIPGAVAGVGKAIVDAIVNGIKSAGNALLDAIKGLIPGPLKSVLGKVPGIGSILGGQHGLGQRAWYGGGLTLVGERGPELLNLPGGSQVIPTQGPNAPAASDGFGEREIHVHLDVEGRELAHVVATEASDQQARR